MTSPSPVSFVAPTTMEPGESDGSLVGGGNDLGEVEELGEVGVRLAVEDVPVASNPSAPVSGADAAEPAGPEAHALTKQMEPMAPTSAQPRERDPRLTRRASTGPPPFGRHRHTAVRVPPRSGCPFSPSE